jgi:hypothetical protein
VRAVTAHGTAVRAVAAVTTVHTVAAAGGRAAIGAMGRDPCAATRPDVTGPGRISTGPTKIAIQFKNS